MRNLIAILALLLNNLCGLAQDYSNLKTIQLNDSIQCKNAEGIVLECANHLLSIPYVEDLKSINASQFILEWMGKTPDYTFSFEDNIYKSIKSDLILSSRYLASQSKVAITEKPKVFDIDFQLNYFNVFLEYCENTKYKVKLNSKIKKLIAAKNNGTLKEELVKS
jgi:hypothetical protein